MIVFPAGVFLVMIILIVVTGIQVDKETAMWLSQGKFSCDELIKFESDIENFSRQSNSQTLDMIDKKMQEIEC